jgi:hypothetical protein
MACSGFWKPSRIILRLMINKKEAASRSYFLPRWLPRQIIPPSNMVFFRAIA